MEYESILPRLDATAESLQSVTALEDSTGGSLSWSEMTFKSRALARVLRVCMRLGGASGSGRRVGLLQEPTVDWIVTMLGVWRTGASYVPLDLSQGLARLAKIVEDARLTAIVVHDATLLTLEELQLRLGSPVAVVNVSALLYLGDSSLESVLKADPEMPSNMTGGDEAMVLYTSGTTGEPKVSRDWRPFYTLPCPTLPV